MSTHTSPSTTRIDYPSNDGNPMSENTLQFRWIYTIQGGLAALFRDRADVFVAGDLLWYPVEGDNKTRLAPDAMVAFGRPKGDRGSYMQWLEGNIAPQVVFEVLSPGNRRAEMIEKLAFYERFGVEEYYVYDPERVRIWGYQREGEELPPIAAIDGWWSPRLGIQFVMAAELEIHRPDGELFLDFVETDRMMREERRRRLEAERIADEERQQRLEADRRAEEARQQRLEADRRAEEARQQFAQLLEKLREKGIDPDTLG